MRKEYTILEILRYLCLICVIAFGLFTIVGTGGGGDGGGGGSPSVGGGGGNNDDHGNSIPYATFITLSENVNGNIETGGDVDYFAFTATNAKTYTIETSSGTLDDTVIYLYDENSFLIDSDDDSGVGYASKITWTCNLPVPIISGTYYVKVEAYDYNATGTYTLMVQEVSGSGGYVDLSDGGLNHNGFFPDTVSPGDLFSVWCRVQNTGTSDALNFEVAFYASTNSIISSSDYLIGRKQTSVYAGGWSDVALDLTNFPSVPAGTYYVGYIIDSTLIIAETNESNNTEVCNLIQLTVTSGPIPSLVVSDGFRPRFSPDGLKIVFVRLVQASTEDSQADIWRVNIDGTGLTHLTNTPFESEYSPQWTPDGQRISFLRKPGTILSNDPGKLWDMSSDGTNQVLSNPFNLDMDDFCHYTRNGSNTEILALSNGELLLSFGWPSISGYTLRRNCCANNPRASSNPSATGSEPYIVMNDSTARKIVVFNPVNLDEYQVQNAYDFPKPFISPSGTKIVAGTDGGLPWGLYLMNIDGSNLTQITSESDHHPCWHGDTVIFVRVPPGGTLRHGDIYKITGIAEQE